MLAVATNLPEIAIVVSAALSNSYGRSNDLPWQQRGVAPDAQPEPKGHAEASKETAATSKGHSTARVAAVFGVAAHVTLAASGWSRAATLSPTTLG
jgi:cation:H+ antiporter